MCMNGVQTGMKTTRIRHYKIHRDLPAACSVSVGAAAGSTVLGSAAARIAAGASLATGTTSWGFGSCSLQFQIPPSQSSQKTENRKQKRKAQAEEWGRRACGSRS